MPIVTVQMAEGVDADGKLRMMTAITDAIERTIGVRRASIRVILNEFPLGHFMAGGISPGAPANADHGGDERLSPPP